MSDFLKGRKGMIENYEPTVILCNFSKVFEVVLYEILYSHPKSQIIDFQHGFLKEGISNLTCATHHIANALDVSY